MKEATYLRPPFPIVADQKSFSKEGYPKETKVELKSAFQGIKPRVKKVVLDTEKHFWLKIISPPKKTSRGRGYSQAMAKTLPHGEKVSRKKRGSEKNKKKKKDGEIWVVMIRSIRCEGPGSIYRGSLEGMRSRRSQETLIASRS